MIKGEDNNTIVDQVVQANLKDSYCSKLRHSLQTGYPSKEIDSRHFSDLSVDSENCIRRYGRLWVPESFYLLVIREVHDQIASGHPGRQKTISLLARNYYWPKMKDTVYRYIRNCHTCRRAKAPRDRYNGILKPLPIPTRPWTNVTLDFVTGLPSSNGYNAVLMVIDRLTKERHYIPCTTDENGTTAEATAYLLLNNVWKLHGLPLSLTSDRGPQFISGVWKNLCKILGIKVNLSTTFHPETDRQSEIANQEMERHLRTFVNYQQDDWSDKLAMAEFAANNNESASTKLSPFFATKGLHPRMSFDIVELSDTSTRERILKQKALDISGNMEATWEFARKALVAAQDSQLK